LVENHTFIRHILPDRSIRFGAVWVAGVENVRDERLSERVPEAHDRKTV
jgi:hypothetical protein